MRSVSMFVVVVVVVVITKADCNLFSDTLSYHYGALKIQRQRWPQQTVLGS